MLKRMHMVVCSQLSKEKNSGVPHPVPFLTRRYLSSQCTLTLQVRWNEPGAHYYLVEKEKLPRFPFSIDQEGDIYVTQPLDREEKDSVSKTGRSFTRDETKCCARRELRAEKILLKTSNNNPKLYITDLKT